MTARPIDGERRVGREPIARALDAINAAINLMDVGDSDVDEEEPTPADEAFVCLVAAKEALESAVTRESPTPIDGEKVRQVVALTKELTSGDIYSDSSASPERQTGETGKAGSDGAYGKLIKVAADLVCGRLMPNLPEDKRVGPTVIERAVEAAHELQRLAGIAVRDAADTLRKAATLENAPITCWRYLHGEAHCPDAAPLTRVDAAVPSPIQAESLDKDVINGLMDRALRRTATLVAKSASLPLEAAPSLAPEFQWKGEKAPYPADALKRPEDHVGDVTDMVAPPSALDVDYEAAHYLTMFGETYKVGDDDVQRGLVDQRNRNQAYIRAALEREHARAEKWFAHWESENQQNREALTKVAALEARLAETKKAFATFMDFAERLRTMSDEELEAWRVAAAAEIDRAARVERHISK